jgi:hypothetical protein
LPSLSASIHHLINFGDSVANQLEEDERCIYFPIAQFKVIVMIGSLQLRRGGFFMKCLRIYFIFFVSAFLLAGGWVHADESIISRYSKSTLYETAASELSAILAKMPAGDEAAHGFDSRSEFAGAGLGIPYQEYSMLTKKPTGFWRIPVTVNGENRALVRYALEDGVWKWKGFGAAGLARELGEIEDRQSEKPLSGKILRDYKLTCDYIQFNIESEYSIEGSFIPTANAKKFMEFVSGTTSDTEAYGLSQIQQLRSKFLEIKGDTQEGEPHE